MRAQNERGSALMTVLAVIVALTTVAAVVLVLSGRELSLSAGHHRSLEAFYIAEAGGYLARGSLQRFVIVGLTHGLHQQSEDNLEQLHASLADLVAGSGKLEHTCERAQSSSSYSGRQGVGSNSLGLFDIAASGPSGGAGGGQVLTGSPNGAPAQTVRYRYAPETGVFGIQADGPEDLVTPLGAGGFTARITLSRDANAWADRAFPECGGEPRYVFPYRYTIDVQGRAGGGRRRLSLSGAFRVVVEQPGFAQYLLFNSTFGTRPICPEHRPCRQWLSDERFDGPVHTNDRLWIAGNPVFRERVTSANVRDSDGDGDLDLARGDAAGPPVVRFYNGGLECADDAEPGGWCDRDAAQNLPWDAPVFLKGVDRGVHYISLPGDGRRQEWTALTVRIPRGPEGRGPIPALTNIDRRQALGLPLAADDIPPDVFFPTGALTSRVDVCYFRSGGAGGRLRGGLYVGRALDALRLSVDGETSIYELFTAPDHHWRIRIDRGAQRTTVLYERQRTPLTCTYEGVPNGIIFVRGEINELSGPARRRADAGDSAPPAIHRDDAATVVATGTIRIASDLRYQEDPRGPDGVWSVRPCRGDDRCDVRNLLGLYSVGGDILISETTPDDLVIHAVLMAGQGSVGVAAVSARPSQGTLQLLGGKINRYEGLFNSFERSGRMGGGYKLLLRYDHRLGVGMIDPPAFPRLNVIGLRATPGLDDRPVWVERP